MRLSPVEEMIRMNFIIFWECDLSKENIHLRIIPNSNVNCPESPSRGLVKDRRKGCLDFRDPVELCSTLHQHLLEL
jgi:hypothetical protein